MIKDLGIRRIVDKDQCIAFLQERLAIGDRVSIPLEKLGFGDSSWGRRIGANVLLVANWS